MRAIFRRVEGRRANEKRPALFYSPFANLACTPLASLGKKTHLNVAPFVYHRRLTRRKRRKAEELLTLIWKEQRSREIAARETRCTLARDLSPAARPAVYAQFIANKSYREERGEKFYYREHRLSDPLPTSLRRFANASPHRFSFQPTPPYRKRGFKNACKIIPLGYTTHRERLFWLTLEPVY